MSSTNLDVSTDAKDKPAETSDLDAQVGEPTYLADYMI